MREREREKERERERERERESRPWIFFHISSSSSHTCFLAGSVLTIVHPGSDISWGKRERERECVCERERADTDLESSSTFHLLILTHASSRGLFSLLYIRASTFWLSSHCPGYCSLVSLPLRVWLLTNLVSEGRHICFRWFHACTKDLGSPFFLVVFNYCSHSLVTG